MSSQTVNKYEVPLWRVLIIYGLIVGVVSVMAYRLIALQVFDPQMWLEQSVDNYQETISEPAAFRLENDENGHLAFDFPVNGSMNYLYNVHPPKVITGTVSVSLQVVTTGPVVFITSHVAPSSA